MDSLVAEWIKFSDTDLKTAKHIYDTMNPIPLEIVCYHCQQSAEKMLKGFLIYSGVKPAKTHDLESLRNECEKIESSFIEIGEKCARLNDYSSQPRYPFEISITESIAFSALKDCETISEFVKEKINQVINFA